MVRRWSVVALVMTVLIGAAVLVSPAFAQDGTRVEFEVTWQPRGDDDDRCDRRKPAGPSAKHDRVAYFTGFLEVVTIRNHAGDILVMEALSGEMVEADNVDISYCRIIVEANLAPSPGYTVWHEETYLASILPEGLTGDHHLIILAEE